MNANDFADRILNGDVLFFIVVAAVAIVGIILGTAASMVKSTAREKTRREIAAPMLTAGRSIPSGSGRTRARHLDPR